MYDLGKMLKIYDNRPSSKELWFLLSAVDANSTKELASNLKLHMHPTWFGSKKTTRIQCITCLHTFLYLFLYRVVKGPKEHYHKFMDENYCIPQHGSHYIRMDVV